ncbi:DUF3899 domain-containing protein [Ectobacillus sp. SYSU M60031]|uniref:DUF3899 domain-containing protein n=1 Tax=Ectobacillus ponti TaxID=2961894 RepID=A0AA41X8L2_9BACI|nr:DUF3899 domain-containing protein [Ectobacillus ponti]MCP8968303.1 DUF3899 domain-containing protein [Ectobacillus ponti]
MSAVAAVLADGGFLLHFVNSMFYIAMPLVVVGGFMFLIERGFFNTTRYAFRKVFKRTNSKAASLIEEAEPRRLDDDEILFRSYSFHWTKPILGTGLLLAAVSMIISFSVLV